MKALTIRDVAERASVSLGTVSNVLNRPDMVAEDTRERVLKAIDEIGFIRNSAARQMRGARSTAIGLVVLDIDNPFFTEVARGVEDAATEVDHLVILCNSAGIQSREDRQLRLLEEQRVAGVLMTPVAKNPSRLYREIRGRGTPIVLLDRRSSRKDQCSVAVDDISGGRMAAEHLAMAGHRRIGLINGPHTITQCAERREGFLAGLNEHGVRVTKGHDCEMDAMTIKAGDEAAHRLLAQAKRPTALFCANDLLAIGAEHAVLASGMNVPDDVAIIGYDDVPFAAMSFVPLTSVRQPAYDLGYRAAKLLLDEASAGTAHRHEHIVFRPELIARASTASEVGGQPARRAARVPAARA